MGTGTASRLGGGGRLGRRRGASPHFVRRGEGGLMRRAVVEIAQLAEVGADFIGDLQAVQERIVGEQPAVVGVDAKAALPRLMAWNSPQKLSQMGRGW